MPLLHLPRCSGEGRSSALLGKPHAGQAYSIKASLTRLKLQQSSQRSTSACAALH